MTKVDCKS